MSKEAAVAYSKVMQQFLDFLSDDPSWVQIGRNPHCVTVETAKWAAEVMPDKLDLSLVDYFDSLSSSPERWATRRKRCRPHSVTL